MARTDAPPVAYPPATMSPSQHRIGILGLAGVLTGTFLSTFGLSFDIQWHIEVGPDTFFTLSHLMLYAGSAIAGLSALTMILLATHSQRSGTAWPRTIGGPATRVFGGAFTAPLGYLVTGVGAASFLVYGLVDLGWHSIYGFDAVLNSPPHVALFLSISLTMIGSIIVCAAARDLTWGRIGMILSVPVLIMFAPMTTYALQNVPVPFDVTIAGSALIDGLVLAVAAAVLRFRGAAVGMALVLAALQGVLWWFSPWAAHAYAQASGLPLRDGLGFVAPKLPSSVPLFLIAGAIVLEVLLALSRSGRIGSRTALFIGGTATGIVVSISLPAQQLLWDPTAGVSALVLTVCGLSGLVFGAAGGYLAGPVTAMLLADTTRETTPPLTRRRLSEGTLA